MTLSCNVHWDNVGSLGNNQFDEAIFPAWTQKSAATSWKGCIGLSLTVMGCCILEVRRSWHCLQDDATLLPNLASIHWVSRRLHLQLTFVFMQGTLLHQIDCYLDWPTIISMDSNMTMSHLITDLTTWSSQTAVRDVLWSDVGLHFTANKFSLL